MKQDDWQNGKSTYYLISGDYTICNIGIKPMFELWQKSERLGIFANADLAKQHHLTLSKEK